MATKPKLFIYGISGFLGYQLAQRLQSKFLISGICFRNFVKIPNAQIFPVSLKNIDLIEPITRVQEPDFVINAMGIRDRKVILENEKMADSFNVMLPVSAAVLASKLRAKFFHISCTNVYEGSHAPYKSTDVDFTFSDLLGKQKITAESFIRAQTMESTIIRVGKVMGLGSPVRKNDFEVVHRNILSKTPFEASQEKVYSYLSSISFLDAMEEAITSEIPNKHRVFNLGGPSMSEFEFAKSWIEILGRDPKILRATENAEKRNLTVNCDVFRAAHPKWQPESRNEFFLNILRELTPGVGVKKWQKTLQTP